MYVLFINIESTLEVEAAIVNPSNQTVWSPSQGIFVGNPTDAFMTLTRFGAAQLGNLRTLAVNVPASVSANQSLLVVYRLVGDTNLLGDPVPIVNYQRGGGATWGAIAL